MLPQRRPHLRRVQVFERPVDNGVGQTWHGGRVDDDVTGAEPTIDALLAGDTYGWPEGEYDRLVSEQDIGRIALLLRERGDEHAAALMLDVARLEVVSPSTWVDTEDRGYATIFVQPYLIPRFTNERLAEIASAAQSIAAGTGRDLEHVYVKETLPSVYRDWRERLSAELGQDRPSNAARKMRVGPRHPEADGLHFASDAEHKVYAVLKAKQESLPAEDTLSIAPLPGLRVRRHTFEPDLLVLYQGRAGVIEVDGPHHTGRRAADASREGLLRSAGVAHVDRIDVRDATSRADVEQFVERFLRRLLERK